jgi:4-amino-4-deoxy-L-arabinose transferase-like glycosyltransferase
LLIKTTTKILTRFSNRYPYFLLLSWSIPLLLLQGNDASLLAHDESYYATQARWIAEGQDWFAVQWWGTPIYDRAIGLQWLIAISYKLFGRSEITARLPNAIASLISILLTYSIGKRLINHKVALVSACILPTMFLWLHNSHVVSQDVVLTTIELVGIWALLKVDENKLNSRRFWFSVLAGTTLGLGFCLKSFMVALFPIALLPYLWEKKLWQNIGVYWGIAAGAVLPIAWLWASWQRYGWLPFEQLFSKILHLRGSDPNLYNPDNSLIYYFWNLPANTLPWSILAIAGAFWIWQERKKFDSISLLIGYPLVIFCLLTMFSTRMPYYALQILPFWSLFTAFALERLAVKNWFRLSVAGLGIVLLITCSVLTLGIVPIPSQVQPYILFGFIAGITWFALYWFRTSHYWQFAILMPIWLAIALAGLNGTFSDRSPEMRVALKQTAIVNTLHNQVVNFVVQSDLDATDPLVWAKNADHANWLLLSFYTPKLGKEVRAIDELAPDSYAWLSPKVNIMKQPIELIATVQSWRLVKIK